jgi:hypothetical protein
LQLGGDPCLLVKRRQLDLEPEELLDLESLTAGTDAGDALGQFRPGPPPCQNMGDERRKCLTLIDVEGWELVGDVAALGLLWDKRERALKGLQAAVDDLGWRPSAGGKVPGVGSA